MGYGTDYTNGVIAVRERKLLGDKLFRLPEMTAEEVLRTLAENGFGAGEDPVTEEERALDSFIREYASTEADRAYFLLPRDYHNLKTLYKAGRLGIDPALMLAPEGLHSREELEKMLETDPPELGEDATGAQIGAAFDRAMYRALFSAAKYRPDLKKLLRMRVDMTNLLTACRTEDEALARELFLAGGTLKEETLLKIFSEEREGALAGTGYEAFYAACLAAGKPPFTEAERMRESYGERYFFEKRFELQGKEPFLYYVFRRRAEIKDVRTVLVCLNAGVDAREIKRRLIGGM